MQGIGVDLVAIQRIRDVIDQGKVASLFSASEVAYAMRHADPAPRLAGMFAAKEAASKALGVTRYPVRQLEVHHGDGGKPQIERNGERLEVCISISHDDSYAVAVAVC